MVALEPLCLDMLFLEPGGGIHTFDLSLAVQKSYCPPRITPDMPQFPAEPNLCTGSALYGETDLGCSAHRYARHFQP